MIAKMRAASMAGLTDPAADGVMVNGSRPTDRIRSKVQWQLPWRGDAFGTSCGSLTVPRMTWSSAGKRFLFAVVDKGAI